MNSLDKTILLAEKFGVDTAYFTKAYVSNILSSEEYEGLVENVNKAKEYPLKKAVKLVTDFKRLNYDVTTFEQSVYLATRINYLYSVSSEAYYYNPLLSYDVKTELTSLQELTFLYKGKEVPFTELLSDQKETMEIKARAIADRVEYYRNEAQEIVDYDLKKTAKNPGLKEEIRRQNVRNIIDLVLALLSFAAFVYSIATTREPFVTAYSKFPDVSLFSIGLYVYACCAVFSFVFVNFELARWDMLISPYKYFSYFWRRVNISLSHKIDIEAQKLADYLYELCKNPQDKENDLKKFAALKINGNSLKEYAKVYKAREDKALHFFHAFFLVFFLLALLAVIYLVIIFFLVLKGNN